MEFGYLESRIDETVETKMRRLEALRDNFYGTNSPRKFISPFTKDDKCYTKEELRRKRYANILRKRRELIRLVNKKASTIPSIQMANFATR